MRTEVLRIQGLSAGRSSGCDLRNVHLNLYQGEVLGLVGLHDAGKSFLFDCLMGTAMAETGKIFLYEEACPAAGWHGSERIFRLQAQPALVATQSVVENVFVIRKRKKRTLVVPWKVLRQEAGALLKEFGIAVDPQSVISDLSLVERHMVEILKAYISGGTLILIDDIMTPYNSGDYEKLYNVIRRFQERGISFIICGCQMEKLQRLTDRCLFMVNGTTVKMVDNIRRKQLDEIQVLMGGTRLMGGEKKTERPEQAGQVLLTAAGVEMAAKTMMDFQLCEGEIVVMVDFFHQWVPQLVDMVSGKRKHSGTFMLEGKRVRKKSKRIYISDFLESNYMIESLSLRDNLCLAVFHKISTLGFLHPRKARVVERLFKEQYQNTDFTFQWGSLSFAEKMAVYLERIKLQKWKVMFCTNIENVMSYELEDMISSQLRDMVRGRRTICICASSFEKYSRLADYFLFVTDENKIRKFTYAELCEYFKI